jgi:hypothetical protein
MATTSEKARIFYISWLFTNQKINITELKYNTIFCSREYNKTIAEDIEKRNDWSKMFDDRFKK